MSLIKKVFKIANIKADEIIEESTNKKNRTQLLKDDEFMSSYYSSNERIERLRQSIQNTKQ